MRYIRVIFIQIFDMTLMNINSQQKIASSVHQNRRTGLQFNALPKESRKMELHSDPAGRLTELEPVPVDVLGKNFPEGCMIRFQIKADVLETNDIPYFLKHLHITYASPFWEKISNIPISDVIQNSTLLLKKIHPDDLMALLPMLRESLIHGSVFNTEIRYCYAGAEMRWYHITIQPRHDQIWVVCDSFLQDITVRKRDEMELSLYRSALEPLIRERMYELEATKEELTSVKKELERKNIQLHNEMIAHMKVVQQLENYKKAFKTSSKINRIN